MSVWFVPLAVVCVVLTTIMSVVGYRRGMSFRAMFRWVLIWALTSIPLVGLLVGSWVSHGFDVPWWLFGVINALLILLSFLLTVSLALQFSRLQGKK